MHLAQKSIVVVFVFSFRYLLVIVKWMTKTIKYRMKKGALSHDEKDKVSIRSSPDATDLCWTVMIVNSIDYGFVSFIDRTM
jgi:hypothetical protein